MKQVCRVAQNEYIMVWPCSETDYQKASKWEDIIEDITKFRSLGEWFVEERR